MNHEDRILNVPGLLNTRDLGGLPVEGGGITQFGRLIRGPEVDTLQPPGIDALIKGQGVTREIDLREKRTDSLFTEQVEEHRQISAYREEHMEALNHQFKQAIEFKQVIEWDHVAGFMDALSTSPGVPTTLALLADDSQRTTYIHCSLGKDRTGMICGVILSAIGVPREAVVEDYALSERDIDEYYERLMAADEATRKFFGAIHPTTFRTFKSTAPENMEKMLDHLNEQYGSSADYIRKFNNGDAILAGLRRKLVDM